MDSAAFTWESALLGTTEFPRAFLDKVAAVCEREIVEEVIPFWVANGIDEVHGGFICGLHHNGRVDDDSKFSWYQGRGAWVFARLFQKTGEESFLVVARRTLEFVRRHILIPAGAAQSPPGGTSPNKKKKNNNNNKNGSEPWNTDGSNGNVSWKMWTVVARDGKVLPGRSKVDDVGYAALFFAEGLQAVALHEPDSVQRQRMLKDCVAILKDFHFAANDPDRDAPENSYLLHAPYAPGTRTLGHSMIPLRICTQLLRDHSEEEALDPEDRIFVESLAAECVENILHRHLDPKWGLAREELAHDWSFLDGGGLNGLAQSNSEGQSASPVLFYLGHAVEAFWFVMDEAFRCGDSDRLELAASLLRRHASVAWDELCGGMVRGITAENEHNDKFLKDKVAWVQQEGLVGALMVAARSRNSETVAWARGFFRKLYRWTMDRFPLSQHITLVDSESSAESASGAVAATAGTISNPGGNAWPCPLWLVGGDREAAFSVEYSFGTAGLRTRKENYHHPRFLMLTQRLIEEIQAGPGPQSSSSPHTELTVEESVQAVDAIAEAFAEATLSGVPDLPEAFPSSFRDSVEENAPAGATELELRTLADASAHKADERSNPEQKKKTNLVVPVGECMKLSSSTFSDLYDALEQKDPTSVMRRLGLTPDDRPYALDGGPKAVVDLLANGHLGDPTEAASILEAAVQLEWPSVKILRKWKYD